MAGTRWAGATRRRRALIAAIGISVAVLTVVVASRIGTLFPGGAAAATSSPVAGASPTATPAPASGAPTAGPPTAPPPTPEATPVLVPAPLTGLLVTEEAARRQPIAVMVDDHWDARPQAGFNAAAQVWQAPAEGGVPRYMLLFQDTIPGSVGPVRSARQYYIEWASEWNAMYVHHGGSPEAKVTLARRGDGEWVWNADGFRWEGSYVFRVDDRFAPHNVMTDGEHLRELAKRIGADDEPLEPAWTFGSAKDRLLRPTGGRITVVYPYETVTYRYDAKTNTYPRYLDNSKKPQVDVGDGGVVAPTNVVILRMYFGPLNDGSHKERLDAHDVGKGEAWVSTNGTTFKAQWRKASPTAPTLLFNLDGTPVQLTAGQTFVQVIPLSYSYDIDDGPPPAWIPPKEREP